MKINFTATTLCFAAAMLLASVQANATPAFARSNNMPCAACHTAYPALNGFGRQFKTNGYRIVDASKSEKVTDFEIQNLSNFPISAGIISRPFVKDNPGNSEIRAVHELEIFMGGTIYKNLSGFLEIESEGEDGFGNVLGLTALNYDFNNAFHVQVAYAPTFFADPYSTLSSSRRLTASHYNILNDTYGNADNGDKLRHSRQQASIFGRLANNRLFYNLGIGGLTGDNVANQSTVGFARIAYDITPNIMIGAFDVDGSCDLQTASDVADCSGSTSSRDFSRYGFDTQIDMGQFRFTGVYLKAKDDFIDSTGTEKNEDSYAQLTYFGKLGNNNIVPLLRYQTSQVNDGNDETKRITLGLSYYIYQNFKGSIEYSDDTSTPAGVDKSSNLTLQFMVAF